MGARCGGVAVDGTRTVAPVRCGPGDHVGGDGGRGDYHRGRSNARPRHPAAWSRRAWRGRERCCGAHAGTPCDVAIPCPIARLPSKTSVAWNRPRRRFGTRRSGQDMSVLRSLESKIATLVEGTFSRAFRSEVRPVEIARKLAREMEEHKSFSVSRTYAPNEYRVFLSPRDRERFSTYEGALAAELAGYLLEHARRERLTLLSRPVIEFETDARLGLGEFGIQTGVVQPAQEADQAAAREESGRTMIYSNAGRVAEPLEERAQAHLHTALLLVDGRRVVVGPAGATIGRSRQCEVVR